MRSSTQRMTGSYPAAHGACHGRASSGVMRAMQENAPIVWQPTPEQVAAANVTRLMQKAGVDSYEALHAWSVEDIGRFWDTVPRRAWAGAGTSPTRRHSTTARASPSRRWFRRRARLNLVHQLSRAARGGAAVAMPSRRSLGRGRRPQHRAQLELRPAVGRCRTGRQACCASSVCSPAIASASTCRWSAEVVIALFACFQVGAVADAGLFRLRQRTALAVRLQRCRSRRALHRRRRLPTRQGQRPIKPAADDAVAERCPSRSSHCRSCCAARAARRPVHLQDGRDLWWDEERVTPIARPDRDVAEVLDSEAPAMLLYTSGTTGKPKGTVHTHGGCLAQISKELGLRLRREAGGLALLLGHGHRLDDGTLGDDRCDLAQGGGLPRLRRCAQLAEGRPALRDGRPPPHHTPRCGPHRRSVCYVAPATTWLKDHDLSSLRILGSTGEPWDPESWTVVLRARRRQAGVRS